MTDLSGQPPRMRFCPSCGTQSDIDWRYCAGCGGRLPRLEDLQGRLRPEQSQAAETRAERTPEPVVEPVVEAAPEPAVEPTVDAAPEPAVEPTVDAAPEPAVEPTVEAPPEPVVDTGARPIGSGRAKTPERSGQGRRPRPEPPRHGVAPEAEPRGERPRRRRNGSDRIAALIEGPQDADRDRRTTHDGHDEVVDADRDRRTTHDSRAGRDEVVDADRDRRTTHDSRDGSDGRDEVVDDAQTLIDATAVVDPHVPVSAGPAAVATETVDPPLRFGRPGADDRATGPATDHRAPSGEIHLEPLLEVPNGSGAGAIGRPHPGRVTTSVQFAALASAALGVALVAGLVRLNRRLTSFAETSDAGPVDDADRLVERVLQPAFFVCVLILLVALVWWTRVRRLETNALGFRSSRFSDGLAVASWLIPGANLVLSTMVLGEMWRASRAVRRGGEWEDEPSSPWLFAWALLLGAGAVVAIAAATADPSTVAGTIDANTWSGIGYALVSLGLLVLALTLSAVAMSIRLSLRVTHNQVDSLDGDRSLPDPVMA